MQSLRVGIHNLFCLGSVGVDIVSVKLDSYFQMLVSVLPSSVG